MDTQSLRTASTYINNLLLSRGLLRNGAAIEFATPAKAEGSLDATMGKVMNLVHDLILRRDRETDTLSSLSQNLQNLRSFSAQQAQTIARLESRNADLDRQVALTGVQERAARASLRTAEARTKALREEMARLKGTVAQIRAQCATDIRRRDVEMRRLKKHLEGRRGKDGNGGQLGVVVVTAGTNRAQQGARDRDYGVDVGSPEYSLKQETTEFLTQLSQGLSDENDALIDLVRNTLATLRSLQGLPASPLSSIEDAEGASHASAVMTVPPSYESLATSANEVLEHLRGLLTSPNFVPLEEVEIREEEIIRLREGWEKMEARWKEAVALMDGWRRRMVDTGDTINLDDLTKGLELDHGLAAPVVHQGDSCIMEEEEEEGLKNSASSEGLVEDIDSPSRPDFSDESFVADPEPDLLPTKKPLASTSANVRPLALPNKQLDHLEPTKSSHPISTNLAASRNISRIPKHVHSSPHTVAQKLALAQAEAEDAQRSMGGKRKSGMMGSPGGGDQPKLRTGRKSRRRSTLSAQELEQLIGL